MPPNASELRFFFSGFVFPLAHPWDKQLNVQRAERLSRPLLSPVLKGRTLISVVTNLLKQAVIGATHVNTSG